MRSKIVRINQEIGGVQSDFAEMQLLCKDLVNEFKKAKFSTRVATQWIYDEHTNFNENNITMYLSEIEEQISSLLTYVAHKRGDPHAPLSSVPFEALNTKDHSKRDMAIDNTFEVRMATTDEEEEGDLVDVKNLYQRFHEKLERGMLQVNQKTGPRKDGQKDD